MANIGKKLPGLKRARKNALLTQAKLAEKINVTEKAVKNWESQKHGATDRIIASLCNVLNVDENSLTSRGSPEIKDPDNLFSLNKIMEGFTRDQARAVYAGNSNLVVIAGAGSGKTQVVISRAINLITKHDIAPDKLVMITFTEKAALEIKERLSIEYQKRYESLKGFEDIFVGTIHQYCYGLIRELLPEYLSYDLLDGMDQFVFVLRHFNKLLTDMSYEEQYKSGSALGLKKIDGNLASFPASLNMILPILNALRESEIDISKVSEEIKLVLKRYRNQLEKHRFLDFSSLLEIVTYNLKTNQTFRDMIASKLDYLIVDEYQDTNSSLEKVISELVSASSAKLTVVGDDDQAIYGWNNGQVENLTDFNSRYLNVEEVLFPDNFRSTIGIIDTAYRIVGSNLNRKSKSITAKSHNVSENGDILALKFNSLDEEANFIVEQVARFLGYPFKDKPEDVERGLSYSDMAVLVRTRTQAQHIVSRFEALGIPYEFKGSNGIISGSSLGKALAYIFYYLSDKKISVDDRKVQIGESELFDAWSKTKLGLKEKEITQAINSLKEFRAQKMPSNSHSKWAPQNALHIFIDALQLEESSIPNLSELAILSTGEQAFLTIGQFSQMISKFERLHAGRVKANLVYKDLANYLEFSADNNFIEENTLASSRDVVNILTIHSAKGLEWPIVFIPGMNKNRFPIKRRGGLNLFHFIDESAFSNPYNYKSPVEEERRLAFVAITRSKKYLFMSSSDEGNQLYKATSDFFEIARQSIDNYVIQHFSEDFYRKDRLKPTPKIAADMITVPFSAIFEHRKCPYSHKLRRIYGLSPVYNEMIGFGNVLHNAINDYHRQRLLNDKQWALEELPGLITKHLHFPFSPPPVLKEKLEVSLLRRMEIHHRQYGETQGIEYIERDVTYHSAGIRIEGRLDMLRMYQGDRREIIDYKSSKDGVHQDEKGSLFQVKAYALSHEMNTGETTNVVKTITLLADKPAIVQQELINCDVLNETKHELDRYIAEIKENIYPKRPCNPEQCAQCDVKAMCH